MSGGPINTRQVDALRRRIRRYERAGDELDQTEAWEVYRTLLSRTQRESATVRKLMARLPVVAGRDSTMEHDHG